MAKKFYAAPMEGITGYLYRNAHHRCFGNTLGYSADKYFIPFIIPNQKGKFNTREMQDVIPEHNRNITAVPQILTNQWEDFVRTARTLEQMGYNEINLNLGCPSRTVVSKKRGAGFLSDPKRLDAFLDAVFTHLNLKISVKTRIGKDSPDEWEMLMEIYNKYPLEELIIHPRIQTDFYKNKPNLDVFCKAIHTTANPVCYNGDICTVKDYETFTQRFPQIETMMLGRGLLRNPGLILEICEGSKPEKEQIKEFHDLLYEGYRQVLFGEKTVLFKMKELWSYMGGIFTDSETYIKKIRKSEKLWKYEEAVDALFREQNIMGAQQ